MPFEYSLFVFVANNSSCTCPPSHKFCTLRCNHTSPYYSQFSFVHTRSKKLLCTQLTPIYGTYLSLPYLSICRYYRLTYTCFLLHSLVVHGTPSSSTYFISSTRIHSSTIHQPIPPVIISSFDTLTLPANIPSSLLFDDKYRPPPLQARSFTYIVSSKIHLAISSS